MLDRPEFHPGCSVVVNLPSGKVEENKTGRCVHLRHVASSRWIHAFLTLRGHFRISRAERRVDGLARRVDRIAVARDAYEIFICVYIAARGFVRPRDTAP